MQLEREDPWSSATPKSDQPMNPNPFFFSFWIAEAAIGHCRYLKWEIFLGGEMETCEMGSISDIQNIILDTKSPKHRNRKCDVICLRNNDIVEI